MRRAGALWCSVLAWCLACASRSPRCDLACLAQLQFRADSAHRFDRSLRYARQMVELAPTHPATVYGMARALAEAGRRAEALRWLNRLASLGDTRVVPLALPNEKVVPR